MGNQETNSESKVRGEGAKYVVGFYHYGVILTYLSVIAGVVGMALAVTYNAFWGVVCLFISGICDSFDGAVARTRKNRSDADRKFGVQIDSLSDVIAFGIAPVFIGYALGMKEWYYLPVFCLYALCALIRLAYYNVTEETRASGKRVSFEGLPVTNSAIGLPVFYVIATMFVYTSPLAMKLIMAGAYLLVAVLFVLRFRMPKVGIRGILVTIAIVAAIVIPLCFVRYYVCGVPLIP